MKDGATRPLQGLRIVATVPPYSFFGGVDFNFAVEMIEELRELGATVFELDTGGFDACNGLYIERVIAELKAFRSDVAVSLPNAGYAIMCTTLEGKNIFKDVLQIPTVMLWDHGLLQFPRQILAPLPKRPGSASGGAIERLRNALDHPLFFHYSPDRGHVAAMDKLGVMDAGKVRFFLQPAYPNFVRCGYGSPPGGVFRTRVAFAGNVYLEASKELPYRDHKILAGVETRALDAKRNRITDCLWDLLLAEIQALDPPTRNRLRLDPDSSFFWSFFHDEIEVAGNTDARLSVLAGLQHDYEFFGNFIEPGAVSTLRNQYRIKFRRSLDYFTELPLLFMNSDLIVDVINLGYNTGISPKVMGCMACGGMILFDYKEDFYQSFGEAANLVTYRSVEQLNSLVEEYLSNPRKRRDVSRYFQHKACTEFSFRALCKRLFVEEPVWHS